jgi:hypothetical protein
LPALMVMFGRLLHWGKICKEITVIEYDWLHTLFSEALFRNMDLNFILSLGIQSSFLLIWSKVCCLSLNPSVLLCRFFLDPGIVPSIKSVIQGDVSNQRASMSAILDSTWAAATQPDPEDPEQTPFTCTAIIANPVVYGHYHIAEKLGIPCHVFFTMVCIMVFI